MVSKLQERRPHMNQKLLPYDEAAQRRVKRLLPQLTAAQRRILLAYGQGLADAMSAMKSSEERESK